MELRLVRTHADQARARAALRHHAEAMLVLRLLESTQSRRAVDQRAQTGALGVNESISAIVMVSPCGRAQIRCDRARIGLARDLVRVGYSVVAVEFSA